MTSVLAIVGRRVVCKSVTGDTSIRACVKIGELMLPSHSPTHQPHQQSHHRGHLTTGTGDGLSHYYP